MARVMVPTMPARIDHNPQGSATMHVTMPSANPFERESVSVRTSNQPGHAMMPGMGTFTEGFLTQGGTGGSAVAGAVTGQLMQALIPAVGDKLLNQWGVTDQPSSPPAVLPTVGATLLNSQQAYGLPVGSPQVPPEPKSIMPWVLGGVGILAVGAILLTVKRKKG